LWKKNSNWKIGKQVQLLSFTFDDNLSKTEGQEG